MDKYIICDHCLKVRCVSNMKTHQLSVACNTIYMNRYLKGDVQTLDKIKIK